MTKSASAAPRRPRGPRRSQLNHSGLCAGEAAHLAHAIAHVMSGLTPAEVARRGEDLLDMVAREVPVPALAKIKNSANPVAADLRAVAKELAAKPARATALDRILAWLGDIFAFDETERAILGVFVRFAKLESWRELGRRADKRGSNLTTASLACFLGIPANQVEGKLMPGARLLSSQLISDDRDGEFSQCRLLWRISHVEAASREELERWLMPEREESTLAWDDFDHLGAQREIAAKIAQAREPASILLFGEPGTGKSEFARLLARQIGAGATFAGLADEGGMEPNRHERLAHLFLLRAMCGSMRDRLIIVDEADDVLAFHDRKSASKQWINRLVEDPKVTTIWIVNRSRDLDPAVLRRMTLAVHFERPKLPVRERIVKRAAAATNLALTDAEVQEIAALKTSPAVIASGLRAAHVSSGGADIAQTAIRSVMGAMGHSRTPERRDSEKHYDPALSRADTDLSLLADRLAQSTNRGWSLLLSGPSGTGKTAFARYLAERLGLEIEVRRGSDLLGPFVGETEQKIAAAFSCAADRGAMLLIDEADSFLYRRGAEMRSWEVSQVNEMLVQMEHLRAPFVATTNFADVLDPAAQRRFTLRASFEAMTTAQVAQLFKSHFGQAWPRHLPLHEGQTPGDFAVVAKRGRLLGEADPLVLVRWLQQEIEARGDQSRGVMGFQLSLAECGRERQLYPNAAASA